MYEVQDCTSLKTTSSTTQKPVNSRNMSYVQVLRGGLLESRHRVNAAIVKADGRLIASVGDPYFSSFLRSSAKPFQALRLIPHLEQLGLNSAHLAVAMASHNGEPIHVNVVNFVLVLVLANLLCSGRAVAIVTLACASAMVGIAYHQSLMATGGQGREVFVETVVQFLPQFIFMALLLRMTSARANARD